LGLHQAKSVSDADASLVPVRGPDALCNGKMWRITGRHGEVVAIHLSIKDAELKGWILIW